MTFMRRKSMVYHEDIFREDLERNPLPQAQQIQRRRLSKPLTNSSLALLNERSSNIGDCSCDTLPPQLTANDSREALREHLFSQMSASQLSLPKPRISVVASLASKFEHKASDKSAHTTNTAHPGPCSNAADTEQLSLGVHDLSKSHIATSNTSSTSLSSRSHDASGVESIPPPRRAASFRPGIATRSPHKSRSMLGTCSSDMLEEDLLSTTNVSEHDQLCARPTEPSQDRSATPSDLDRPSLGRYGLGSLRVMNATASPARFEPANSTARPLYQLLAARKPSSNYPESEFGTIKSRKSVKSDWEDEPLPADDLDEHCTSNVRRAFSFKPGSEAKFFGANTSNAGQAQFTTPGHSRAASAMTLAEDYRSEIPASPFGNDNCSEEDTAGDRDSPSVALVERQEDKTNSSAHESSEEYVRSAQLSHDTVGQPKAPSSSPSLRSVATRSSRDPQSISRDSPVSFFSTRDDDTQAASDIFESAIDLSASHIQSPDQVIIPFERPRSSSRTSSRASPAKVRKEAESDSGYSSNTSLARPSSAEMEAQLTVHTMPQRRSFLPFASAALRTGKPILVKPSTSTKPRAPASAAIESVSAPSTVIPSIADRDEKRALKSGVAAADKIQTKQRKKLQKARRKSVVEIANELVLHKMVSINDLRLPPVSPAARANLAQRSRMLPELNSTYEDKEGTSVLTVASTGEVEHALFASEIKFPAASEDPGTMDSRGRRSRTKSRRRSLSRPRTWFGWSTENAGIKHQEKDRAEHLDLSELSATIDLLGTNPYDMAQATRHSPSGADTNGSPKQLSRSSSRQRQMAPSNISTTIARPRSGMDDTAAADLSRSWQNRRSMLDDRNSVQGRMPNPVQSRSPTPPMPKVPTVAELNRRMPYRGGYATHPKPIAYENQGPSVHKQTMQHRQHGESGSFPHPEAPPPPPHSPRPSYVDHEIEDSYFSHGSDEQIRYAEDDFNDFSDQPHGSFAEDDLPPLPPCHSPQPMDVHYQDTHRSISWSEQAQAWRNRRQSVGAALHDSWSQARDFEQAHSITSQQMQYYHDDDYHQPGWAESGDWSHDVPLDFQYELPAAEYYEDYNQMSSDHYHCTPAAQPDAYVDEWHHSAAGHAPRPHSTHRSSWNEVSAYPEQDDYDMYEPRTPRDRSRSRETRSAVKRHSARSDNFNAEETTISHPEVARTTPQIGRYSGGLEYNYDRQSKGFAGSAGTRSVSTAQSKARTSWLHMEAYGVDLADIPDLQVPVGATGNRMVYR